MPEMAQAAYLNCLA